MRAFFLSAMFGPYHKSPVRRHGFTLIELLLVLVILGTMAAIVVPQIGAGMAGAKLATAARSVTQAARYARTMALLHQAETELSLDPGSGTIKVQAKTGSGFIAQQLQTIAREEKEAREAGFETDPEAGEEAKLAALTNRSAAVSTAKTFSEEIDMEFKSGDVTYSFLGYTDTVDEPPSAGNLPDEESGPIVIAFRSNGTCRPFRVRVMNKEAPEDDYMDVSIDIMGTGKIEGTGEEE